MSGGTVFVSYDRTDRERFVDGLAEELRRHGVPVWVDHGEIQPGDSVVQRIFADGLARADVVLAVVSPASLVNPWCRVEWETAVYRWITGGCRLLVVRLDEVELPPPLHLLAWVDVAPDADWSEQFGRLLRSVQEAGPQQVG